MKLNSELVKRSMSEIAEPVPEDDLLAHKLSLVLGEHTYFLTEDGLIVVEPVGSNLGIQTGQVFKIAAWDDERLSLVPHEPEPTGVVVALDEGEDENSA